MLAVVVIAAVTAAARLIIAVRAEVIVIAAVVVAVLVIAAAGEGLQLLLLPLILPYLNLHCVHYPQHPSSISFLASRSHSPPLRHARSDCSALGIQSQSQDLFHLPVSILHSWRARQSQCAAVYNTLYYRQSTVNNVL